MDTQTSSSEEENRIYYFMVFKDIFSEYCVCIEYGLPYKFLTDIEKREVKKLQRRDED